MKKLLYILIVGAAFILSPEVFAQKGIGTNTPDKSAALDIVSTKRGLLIPRINIPSLDDADPVANPAHALLVFNKGNNGDTPEGFYWWSSSAEGGVDKWIAVTAGITGGPDPVQIDGLGVIQADNPQGNDWEISIIGGPNENDVLVTDVNGNPAWVPISTFLNDLSIVDDNGITIIDGATPGEKIVQLGGTLTENETFINTDQDHTLGITGMVDITDDFQDTIQPEDIWLVVMDENGILKRIKSTEFLEQVDLEVNLNFINGIKRVGDDVKLGGPLTEATIITTTDEHTLAIAGLEELSAGHFVTVDDTGVLRTAQKSVPFSVTTSGNVTDGPGYSIYALEINIDVDLSDLSGGDIDLELPDASLVEGQVISIKLSGGLEADNYLNINEGATTHGYGALPYQSWVLKSNGTNWRLVSQ